MKDYNHLLLADKEPFHVQKALYDGEMKELCAFVLRLINTLEEEEALGRTFNDATNYERLRLTESEFGWAHGLDLANNFSDGLAVGHFSPTHGGDVCTFNRPGLINFINFTLKGKRDCIQRYLDAEHAGQSVDDFFLRTMAKKIIPAADAGTNKSFRLADFITDETKSQAGKDKNMEKFPISGAVTTDSAESELVLTADEPKESESEYMKVVRAHIKRGQQNLDKLPANQRRALTLETLRHFGCGYITDWVHPKFCVHGQEKKFKWLLALKQERIIIPTANHYNAVMLDRERNDGNSKHWKEHTTPKELFNEPALLSNSDVILVVEGEIDAMSIWQASQGSVEVVALSGKGERKLLIDALKKLGIKDKKFLILFDNDSGQNSVVSTLKELIGLGYPAVSKILDEFMIDEEIKACADSKGKIDANQILKRRGDEFLNLLVTKIIEGSRADFEEAAERVIADMARKALTPTPAPKKRADRNSKKFQAIENIKAEINSITAADLESRGYLVHSRKGAARPNGYCCPACGSGTHEHESGALTFYTNSTANILKCYSCGQSKDVLVFLAERYGKDTKGKEFFEVLKQAADEFGITYDPKIFKPKTKQERADEINQRRAEALNQLEELRDAPITDETLEEIKENIYSLCEWARDKYDRPTNIKGTVKNLDLISSNYPPLRGLFGRDEFFNTIVLRKNPPWRKVDERTIEFTDSDEAMCRMHLRRQFCELKGEKLILDWIVEQAHINAFHTVKEFFANLPKWDGKRRADSIFIDFLRADDSDFVREITLNWLTAAVARIFHPGCNYQLAPVLFGKQGIGKSRIIKTLGGQWANTLLDDTGDSHAIDAIQRLWLVEIKEMASMKKDVDANKRFVDNSSDVRRRAYERHATDIPRHCVFVCTTNKEQMLNDVTGNRRYPVITCNAEPADCDKLFADLTPEYRNQIWAEVYEHYREITEGDTKFNDCLLELSPETKAKISEIAEAHTRNDGLPAEIQSFVEKKILPNIIWVLMTRENRRKFFVDGKFEIEVGDLDARFKNYADKRYEELLPQFLDVCKVKGGLVRDVWVSCPGGGMKNGLAFYGSEQRNHICPEEIACECFGNRRATSQRITEILLTLEGWERGKAYNRKDPQYYWQKTVFYRMSK